MDSSSDDPLVGCLSLCVLGFLAWYVFTNYILPWLVQAVSWGVAAIAIATVFVVAGFAINLLVRWLIGMWGDLAGVTPAQGRFGLGVVYLTPSLLLAGLWMWWPHTIETWFWLGSVGLAVPCYYWSWWGGELRFTMGGEPQRFNPDYNLPYRLEATVRAEEVILWARVKLWLIGNGLWS